MNECSYKTEFARDATYRWRKGIRHAALAALIHESKSAVVSFSEGYPQEESHTQ